MNTSHDRLPPHSIEAEMCLIGSLALAGEDRTIIAHARQLVGREEFYQADHQVIFDALIRLYDQHRAIDPITLQEELIRAAMFEEVGGREYIARVLDCAPSAAHYAHYAGIVREKALWRQLIAASNDALREAYAPRNGTLVEEATGVIMGVSARLARIAAGAEAAKVYRLSDVIADVLDRMESGQTARIATGIWKLDEVIGGLRKAGKTIIGGRPGMGKSALLKQIALNLAGRGVKTGIITIEETRWKIGENALANISGVPNNRIAFNRLTGQEKISLGIAAETIGDVPYFVVDSARKLSQITAMAQLLATQHGCEVICVDHLHIIDGETDERREAEIRKISGTLKQCWKDLNVAGVEAAQLNRGAGDERPTLDSLRDSGSLGADGDTILLLHRDDYQRKTDGGQMDGSLEIAVAKNKDGACGKVYVDFNEALQLITDADPTKGF